MAISKADGRIDTLDGWRAISVCLVVVSHVFLLSRMGLSDTGPLARLVYLPMLGGLGSLGVHFFFVISGFVICRGLLEEARKVDRISLPAFYVRRFFRIVPPLLVYVFAIWSLALTGFVEEGATGVFRALTFTCNFPRADCGGYLGLHTWSLSVEEQFYLVVPILFLVGGIYRPWTSVGLACALALALLILPTVGYYVEAAFISNFLPISVGVACATNERWVRNAVAAFPAWAFYSAPVVLALLVRLSATRFWVPATILMSLLIAVMLMESAFGTLQANNLFSSNPMRSVGRVSYSIYLWQQLATHSFVNAGLLFYALSVGHCVALAFLSYAYFERPLIDLGRLISTRLISRRSLGHDRE